MTPEEKIKILTEALAFYGYRVSYERVLVDRLGYRDPDEWLYDESEVLDDAGEVAREALLAVGTLDADLGISSKDV